MQHLDLVSLREEARAARYNARKLARRYGVSIRQFERVFHQQIASTPQCWLNALRLQEAAAMLVRGKSVKEVAQDLGFRQASHFSRHFKRHFGISPKRARQAHRNGGLALVDTNLSLAVMPSACSSAPFGYAIATEGAGGGLAGFPGSLPVAERLGQTVLGQSWGFVCEKGLPPGISPTSDAPPAG